MDCSKKIQIQFPENLLDKYVPLFHGKNSYMAIPLQIKYLKNVFVSHEGLCLKNLLLVPNSHFNLTGNEDVTFYCSFHKLVLEQYFVSTFGKSLKKITLNDGEYLHIYTKWFGYFFWLTDCLPKLIKTQHLHERVKILYPKNWDNKDYVKDTLKLFPHLKHQIIPSGVHLQVIKLILPETRKWSSALDPAEIDLTRNFLFRKLEEHNISVDLGEKIYISRKRALRRKPVNNEELDFFLHEQGFRCVCMEEYSFMEQISIMKNASYVVGIHGAGLTNAQFIQPGGAVLELTPDIKNSNLFRASYWRLSQANDAKFFIQFCKVQDSSQKDIYNSDLFVDICTLKNNLKQMLV